MLGPAAASDTFIGCTPPARRPVGSAGQSPMVVTPRPSRAGARAGPARPATRAQPAPHQRGRGGDVRLGAVRGGDADRAPGRAHGRSRSRVDDVVHGVPAVAPAPHGRAGGRKASGADGDVCPGAEGSLRWSSVTRTRQPPAGAGPDVAMSPPRLTSTPPPLIAAPAAAARSAAQALAVAPRSSRTPSGCGSCSCCDRASPSASRPAPAQ